MKTRWWLALGCVLMVACNAPTDDAGGPNDNGAAVKPADETDPTASMPDDTAPAETGSDEEDDKSFQPPGDDDNAVSNSEPETNAGPDTAEPVELTLAEKFAEIESKAGELTQAMQKDMNAAEPADRSAIYGEFTSNIADLANQALELAKSNPASKDGLKVLNWVISRAQNADTVAAATDMIFEHHLDSPDLGQLATQLSRGTPSAQAEARLKKLAEESPHNEVKAAATYAMTQFYKNLLRGQEYAKSNPSVTLPEFVTNFDPESVDLEAMFESLATDYADVDRGGKTYGEMAETELFELRNLSIGCVAPDITAKDFDEVEFSLSDYRGKVVVLDFWGDW